MGQTWISTRTNSGSREEPEWLRKFECCGATGGHSPVGERNGASGPKNLEEPRQLRRDDSILKGYANLRRDDAVSPTKRRLFDLRRGHFAFLGRPTTPTSI